MQYRYLNYRHPDYTMDFWPDTQVQDSSELAAEVETLAFFARINSLLQELGGYSPRFRPQLNALGSLRSFERIRYFRGDTGQQYAAMSAGEGGSLTGDDVVNGGVMIPFYTIRPIRGFHPIRVREEGALHLHVDADFEYRDGGLDAFDRVSKVYEAELA